MKKANILALGLLIAGLLLTSCVELPENPQEVQPFCEELYQDLLGDYPDFPHSFIGYCVATLQTGEPRGYQGLCASASFRDVIGVTTRQQCFEYFETME